MAVTRDEVLSFLVQVPDGAELQSICKGLVKSADEVSPVLSALKGVNWVENPEKGLWKATNAGRAKMGLPALEGLVRGEKAGEVMESPVEVTPVHVTHVPGQYDKFLDIGRSVGIKEDFLKVMTDHLFLGDTDDIKYVSDTLEGMYLRPDVTKRLINIWSGVINKPIPPEIAKRMLPKDTTAAKEAEEKRPTRFSIIGDEITPDPDGEWTFNQARQNLMIKAALNAGANAGVGAEKVSEIIAAITPFIEGQKTAKAEEIEKQTEGSVLIKALEIINQNRGNQQPPLTIADVLAITDKVNEARSTAAAAIAAGIPKRENAFEELERMVNVFDKMKGMFGGGSGNSGGASPVYISLEGVNGQKGAISLDTFFKIQDHSRQVKREDEEAEQKKDTGKTIRGFFDGVSKAAQRFGERRGQQ